MEKGTYGEALVFALNRLKEMFPGHVITIAVCPEGGTHISYASNVATKRGVLAVLNSVKSIVEADIKKEIH
jgi:hypothetical protein